MSDHELIDLLRQRDQQGILELQRLYGPLMRYIISPILPDSREQEECLADLSLLIWDKIHLFDPERGSFKTWLSALTRNTALNRARRLTPDAAAQELSHDLPSFEPGPEEQLLRKERLQNLKAALNTLTSGEQLLFYRKYYYLQSTAQIAAEMGLTERAVEGRLYRLKQKLKHKLRRYELE